MQGRVWQGYILPLTLPFSTSSRSTDHGPDSGDREVSKSKWSPSLAAHSERGQTLKPDPANSASGLGSPMKTKEDLLGQRHPGFWWRRNQPGRWPHTGSSKRDRWEGAWSFGGTGEGSGARGLGTGRAAGRARSAGRARPGGGTVQRKMEATEGFEGRNLSSSHQGKNRLGRDKGRGIISSLSQNPGYGWWWLVRVVPMQDPSSPMLTPDFRAFCSSEQQNGKLSHSSQA